MVQNRKKHSKNSHLIIHFPTISGESEWVIERSGACEQSEQCRASVRVSGASKRVNEWASDKVLTSGFLVILDHSAVVQLVGGYFLVLFGTVLLCEMKWRLKAGFWTVERKYSYARICIDKEENSSKGYIMHCRWNFLSKATLPRQLQGNPESFQASWPHGLMT